MEVNYAGCALCNSTWGHIYEIVENTKLFFCCEVCYDIYKQIIDKIKTNYSFSTIDKLELQGNQRERIALVTSNNVKAKAKINFLNGKVVAFIMQ